MNTLDTFEVKSLTLAGQTITYRAFENIPYVTHPIEPVYQTLNIFVPECYYHQGTINQYDLKSAPIFMPNTVGGYMPGKAAFPEIDRHSQQPNAVFQALCHGYVVVSAGSRGRTLQDEKGHYTGVAPACVIDQKAAIRYLRAHRDAIAGNVDRIITNGTSAGGALSALVGATGNHPLYQPYLEAIGALAEEDHVFASSCYCPIHNLENADAAYEWSFNGINQFERMHRVELPDGQTSFEKLTGTLNAKQIEASAKLKQMFTTYLNALNLQHPITKTPLTLDENGNGTFKQYIQSLWVDSANRALENGVDLSAYEWITWDHDQVKAIDFDQYMRFSTRMKGVPAFDHFDLRSPENELFGLATLPQQHFTLFSYERSEKQGTLASQDIIKLMNPLSFILDPEADTAKHWRIRHGAIDRDTSLAIPAILALSLQQAGHQVDFASPWGIAHAGDYDLDELFAWIDEIVR